MPLTPRQLNRATLARQMLLAREPSGVVDAVRRVVALQAQEPASPYVALWNRVDGFDPADLDAAFADQQIVKASLMRITLHAVAAGDYPTFHAAMVANLRASRLNDRRFAEANLSVAEVDALVPHLLEAAAEAGTGAALDAALADRLGERAHPRVWWALKTFAPLVHAPGDHPWSFGTRPSYRTALPGEPADPSPLACLLRRYLEGFGPASARDFGQFALQRMPKIRAALEQLDLLTREGPDGEVLYDVPGAPVPDDDTPAPPRLLAMWDSILLAYADRSRVIPDAYRKTVIRRNGNVLPTLLVDGYVAGVWRHVDGAIEATAFHPLPEPAWDGLAAEAAGLLAFVTGRDDAVYGRYHHWWDDMPGAEVRRLNG